MPVRIEDPVAAHPVGGDRDQLGLGSQPGLTFIAFSQRATDDPGAKPEMHLSVQRRVRGARSVLAGAT